MKPDQLPNCQIDENDGHFICYVMTYNDEEHMHTDTRWIDGVMEVIKSCVFCGERDVSYQD